MRYPVCLALIWLLLPALALADGAPPPALSAAARQAIARQAAQLLREPGVTRVGFYEMIVNRAGAIVAVSVARSSGNTALDRKILAQLQKGHVRQLPKNSPPMVAFVLPVAFKKNGQVTGAVANKKLNKPDQP
ncbi:energy transducer TonB [Acidiphilium sp. AL]|uniref:Energy transducer TonB n=1 Tax=Acidiphilium iwatense TaxID=768198 RepID=A0ABS9DVG9_9PROT|nr:MULTISPECIES: energy transducer TonB [Acidiphilium]MCF3946726.1 energy transducer TonB [Acidiphilium iwatense]MCU4158697.1 energy transducer TonB [Acidiphilium sp. AL]